MTHHKWSFIKEWHLNQIGYQRNYMHVIWVQGISFLKMGHSLPLFLYFCLFNILLFIVNSLAVTKFLLRIQCIEYSDGSLSWALWLYDSNLFSRNFNGFIKNLVYLCIIYMSNSIRAFLWHNYKTGEFIMSLGK